MLPLAGTDRHHTDADRRQLLEFVCLAPFLFAIVAGTATVVGILSWRGALYFNVFLAAGVALLAAERYRHWGQQRVHAIGPLDATRHAKWLCISTVVVTTLLSFAAARLSQYVTTTELVLVVNLLLVLNTVASLCVYGYPRTALVLQIALLAPICLLMIASGDRTQMYLAGIACLLAGLSHVMVDGVAALVDTHYQRALSEGRRNIHERQTHDELLTAACPAHGILTLDQHLAHASQPLLDLLGTSAQEVLNQPMSVWVDDTEAATASDFVKLRAAISHVDGCATFPLRVLPSGRYVDATILPMNAADGTVSAVRIWLRDRTADRTAHESADLARERLESFAEQNAILVWEIGVHGDIRVLAGLRTLWPPQGITEILGAIDSERAFTDLSLVAPDGTPLQLCGRPVLDGDGVLTGFRGTITAERASPAPQKRVAKMKVHQDALPALQSA